MKQLKEKRLLSVSWILLGISSAISAFLFYKMILIPSMVSSGICLFLLLLPLVIAEISRFRIVSDSITIIRNILLTLITGTIACTLFYFEHNVISIISKDSAQKSEIINFYVRTNPNQEESALLADDDKKTDFLVVRTLADAQMQDALKQYNQDNDILNPSIIEFTNLTNALEQFYKDANQVLVLNEAYVPVVMEITGYEEFESQTAVIKSYSFQKEEEKANALKQNRPVYLLLLSDENGKSITHAVIAFDEVSRKTFTFVLPANWYIGNPELSNRPDKLSFISCSSAENEMNSMNKLLSEDIKGTLVFNSSIIKDVVNKLHGITIETERQFYTIDGLYFEKGTNELNADQAYSYYCETYSLSGGEAEHIQHQMAIIKGIVEKIREIRNPLTINSFLAVTRYSALSSMSEEDNLLFIRQAVKCRKNFAVYVLSGFESYNQTASAGDMAMKIVYPSANQLDFMNSVIHSAVYGQKPESSVLPDADSAVTHP